MKVNLENVSWLAGARKIVNSVSMQANSGEFVGIIGPNGSGKSSLLRLIYRIYKPDSGVIYLGKNNIWEKKTKEVAKEMGVVFQERSNDLNFTVYEIVIMGRTPHKEIFESDNKEDDKIVKNALKKVGMLGFIQRDFRTLSGGEKQRALIARALAQKAKVLILDEPTNHLDIRYQLEILELIRTLKITSIAALHDLNIAAAYCDRIYLLKDGEIIVDGKPDRVLTKKNIRSVFGVSVDVKIHPSTKQLNIVFIGKS
jgi:iron complex transport system ATP-binding protein